MLKSRKSIWINRAELNTEEMGRIATEHSLSYPFAAILAKRGITSEQTNGFLFGDVMFDPALLPDMEKGCQYLRLAAEKGEKVAIVNDYDVDGVTSGTIMKELLQFLGAEVYVFAPDRDIDGYGISIRLIDEAISHGCRTIVTTDNGISAAEQIAYAKQNGCVVVVTDHHEVPYTEKDGRKEYVYPPADAIINQKRPDSIYPFRDICGAMVAYKVAQFIFNQIRPKQGQMLLDRWSELAGIGTVCDVMPLVSENRSIVKKTIEKLRNGSSYIGLRQLLKVQNISPEKTSSYTIGYTIGPCINACSRMYGNVDLAMNLLSEKDFLKAEKIAQKLKATNDERKEMSTECENLAIKMCEENDQKIYLLYLPAQSPHIMGIVAGRIKELTGHPCICLTDTKDGILKGSGRSVEGYNMFAEMNKHKEYYTSFGGHESAVGISLKKENLDTVSFLLNRDMDGVSEELFDRKELIDLYIPMRNIIPQFVKNIDFMEPYGEGNPKIKLVTEESVITKLSRIGNGQYLRISLEEAGSGAEAAYFGNADQFDQQMSEAFGEDALKMAYRGAGNLPVDFIYTPTFNTWQGKTTIQYTINDYQCRRKHE